MIASMMTQQLGFSVIGAPLAAIDRRALSQAWYSALHVSASRASAQAPSKPPATVQRNGGKSATVSHSSDERPRAADAPVARGKGKESRPVRGACSERRAVPSRLARKIEERFLDPRNRTSRATFTIEGSQSRVHVCLKVSGSRIALIALCASPVRAAVAKALQEARFSLARCGIELSVETKEIGCK
ncbi:MAG: hypothetical protein M3R51_08330 [Candidatus Eremiobacteraeota bacterium]|nr:hypothetical protein [Candidatus Eremiobacteraeota bacterium]